jgi:hypothetical protein
MTDVLARRPDDVPGAWPGTGRPPTRPAAAVAAAVLGFEAAALYLAGALLGVVLVAVDGAPAGTGAQLRLLALLVGACVLGGLLLAGGVSAIRGTSRVLLLVATTIETVLLVALAVATAVSWPDADELPDISGVDDAARTIAIGVIVGFAVVLAVLVLRLCLVAAPSVGRWLTAERAGRTSRPGRGLLLGLLVPVAALAVAAVVVVVTAPAATPADDGATTAGGAYRGDSEWGAQFYAGGMPLTPPVAGDPLYSAGSDADAQGCFSGAMAACDDLFRVAPVGDVYEWYGSSCAGRLDHESDGGCVAELGEIAAD